MLNVSVFGPGSIRRAMDGEDVNDPPLDADDAPDAAAPIEPPTKKQRRGKGAKTLAREDDQDMSSITKTLETVMQERASREMAVQERQAEAEARRIEDDIKRREEESKRHADFMELIHKQQQNTERMMERMMMTMLEIVRRQNNV
jgi:hypothetical protein